MLTIKHSEMFMLLWDVRGSGKLNKFMTPLYQKTRDRSLKPFRVKASILRISQPSSYLCQQTFEKVLVHIEERSTGKNAVLI
jgi:hypothetical protein